MKRTITTFLLTFLMHITPNYALAHSFTAALVIEASNPYIKQIKVDFLRAAKEKDGHPDETADGHLGGLDVYILYATDTEKLATLFNNQPIDIVVSFGAERLSNDAQKLATKYNSIFINAENKTRADQGYIVAQRIETAIRPLGKVDDKAALANALKRAN